MLDKYITKAIEELPTDTNTITYFYERDDDFRTLIDLISEEIELEPRELKTTEEIFTQRIISIIENIEDSASPVDDFFAELEAVKSDFEQSVEDFDIIFPWNFQENTVATFNSPFEFRDIRISRVSRQLWEDYLEEAKDNSQFEQFLAEVPSQRFHTSPFVTQKYWKAECAASHPGFAVNEVADILESLCGKIAISAHSGESRFTIRQTTWKYGMTELEGPLCYLAALDGEYKHFFTSYNYTPRLRYNFQTPQEDNFNNNYPKLPNFNGENTELEEHLITALSAYQSAMAEGEPRQSFLEFCRCLEAATLTQDERYSASDPLKRGRLATRPQELEISDNRIERLVEKRNHLIHRGDQVDISRPDREYLKRLSESSIWFINQKRNEFSIEELRYLFRMGSKSDEGILQAKEQHEHKLEEIRAEANERQTKISLIEKLIEWYEIVE